MENPQADKNTLSDRSSFSQSDGYHLLSEQSLSLDKVYIVDLDVKKVGEEITCAVATSESSTEVFALSNSQFKSVASLKGHTKSITNVRFCSESNSLIYSSSLDGKIKLWDLRNGECVKELKDSGMKPLACMDVSKNERILCAGTELVEGDSFLLFWDIRSRHLLGGYWESHTEDITTVSFHPTEPDTIASGSTDGLVNLFDLRESSEDDALQMSLNTESSVCRLRWNSSDVLSLTTHTEAVQLWRRDGAAPDSHWTRDTVAAALTVHPDDPYVVDVHTRADDSFFLLAGSPNAKGENLYTLRAEDSKLWSELPLVGNRQHVRVSQYLPLDDLIITGGESGCLSVWKQGANKVSTAHKKAKTRSKQKQKPY